ncbi:hypothetical protein C4588_02785 [Candidatus Parcubacteria bacterium]|nr:MAG: hypothetical protein C4588_02785 [Candidatus Parcubacteria bacterium]
MNQEVAFTACPALQIPTKGDPPNLPERAVLIEIATALLARGCTISNIGRFGVSARANPQLFDQIDQDKGTNDLALIVTLERPSPPLYFGNKAADFQPDDRVRYVPHHAAGDINHPDAEIGQVSSVSRDVVFVKFDKQVSKLGWEGTTSQACDPFSLMKEP